VDYIIDRAHQIGGATKRSFNKRYVSKIFPLLVSLPLFFNILGTKFIGICNVQSSGQALPISLFAIPLLYGLWFFRSLVRGVIAFPSIPYIRSILWIAGAFIYVNVFAFMIGQIATFGLKSIFFLVQTLIPLLAMFIPIHMVRDRTDIRIVLQYASIGILLGVLATITINFLKFKFDLLGKMWIDNYQGIGIYQLYGYVPNIFATFAPILFGLASVYDSRIKKLFLTAGLLLTLFTITHLPSRSALLIAGFGLFTFIVGEIYFKASRPHSLRTYILLFILILLFVLFSYSPLKPSFSLMFDRSHTAVSVEKRLIYVEKYGFDLFSSPLIGKAYQLDPRYNLGGIIETRVAKPHNQFLDIGVKSGLLALALFMVMIILPVIACFRGLKLSTNKQNKIIGLSLLSALLPSITIHNMVLVPFVQSYSGIVLYMLNGLALSYYGIMKREGGSLYEGRTS